MRNSYIFATGALVALAAGAAVAADAEDETASSGGAGLEEIVITAQKRPEKLQDVTVAAQVISSQALANADIADLSDLNKLSPSVQLNGTINGRVPTGVRGISSVSNEQTVGISSGVEIAIDGVPVPSDSFDANNVAGIQSVEVLLGPQSTLGGRTAAAGLINLTTRGPSSTLQGFGTTTVTDDGEYRFEGFLSGPLMDRVQGSLSAYKSTTQYPITNLATGDKTTQNVAGSRIKLLFNVTDNLDVTLMAHNENTEGKGFNFVYAYITPGNDLLFTPGPFTQAKLLPGYTPSWNNLVYSSPVTTAGADHRDGDYSAIIEGRLPGGYTLTSTFASTEEKQHQVQDLFAVNEYFWQDLTGQTVFFNTQTQNTTVRQKSEELKIVSPNDQTVTWLAGLFWSDTLVDEVYVRTLPPAGLDDHVIPDTKTYDAYARATWNLTPATALIAGLRFNHDEISYQYNQYVTVPSSPPAFYSTASSSQNTPVGDIALRQHFTDNVMGYVSFSRGYSPAAYNTSAVLTSNAAMAPVKKETINSFEIGTKGSYFSHTLNLNADLFNTIYDNYQIQSYLNSPGVLTPPLNLQSGKARTRGAELAGEWLATPKTRLSLSAAYIDARFIDYRNAPCYGLQTVAEGCTTPVGGGSLTQTLSGDVMPNSPRFKSTAGVEQRVPLPDHPYEVVLGATYTYRTRAEMLPDESPYAIQSSFGLLNLRLGVESTDGKFSATAFMNNVTNHHYFTDVEDFWNGPWNGNAIIGQPARDSERYAGFRLNVSF